MFKLLILLILLVVLFYFIYNYHITITPGIIKYPLSKLNKYYFNLYSTEMVLSDSVNCQILFYTNVPWSIYDNNNYIHDTLYDKYYIIEPGYYYHLVDNYKIYGNLLVKKLK